MRTTLFLLASAVAASASASVTFNLGSKISGTLPTAAQAASPFLTAVFTTVTPGTVTLTLTNNAPLGSGIFAPSWLFNSKEAVSFAKVSGVTAGTSYGTQTKSGPNDIKGGLFNIEFTYGNGAFGPKATSVYTLTGATLTETSFLLTSIAGGSNNPGKDYYSAAKIQGYGTSAGIGTKVQTVPEPASMAALGVGALGLLRRRRKA